MGDPVPFLQKKPGSHINAVQALITKKLQYLQQTKTGIVNNVTDVLELSSISLLHPQTQRKELN